MTFDLGGKSGKLLLFGGPYSNLHALEALKKESETLNISPENIICTGDIAGYCAFPEESIQFVKNWGIHCIAGNVEFNLRDEADNCGCNFDEGSRCDVLSKQWFPYAKSKVSPDSLEYLKALPSFLRFYYCEKIYFVLHGAVKDTSEFIFKSTPWEQKKSNFRIAKAEVIIAGHCGIPFVDAQDDFTWINAGVIGMPANDGTTKSWYGILDNQDVQFHRLEYDHIAANEAMLAQPLPTSYAQTLLDGLWDNNDILPYVETMAQGTKIVFK